MNWFSRNVSLGSIKEKITEVADKVNDSVSDFDIKETSESVKNEALNAAGKAKKTSVSAYFSTKEKAVSTYEDAADKLSKLDYEELRSLDYYKESFNQYADLGTSKVSEYFRSTFEVDKSTLDMVEGIRNQLPIPGKNIEDIFAQCKNEAMRRAISSFALGGVLQNIDNHSEEKYGNLSDTYKEFSERTGHAMFDDPNFASMKDTRHIAKKEWRLLDDGYNKDDTLDPLGADIEHVISRKKYYDDILLRAGTTDDDFFTLINSKENLVFADSSLNRSLKDEDIYSYLDKNGTPRIDDPDLIDVEIKSSGRTVTVRKSDIDEAVERAEENQSDHRFQAVKEIGTTVAVTGASMAAQQVVGLIVIETIDIFIDEINCLTVNGSVLSEEGWVGSAKESTSRIQMRLNERFEEKNIWSRAKLLGIESGVAGALSVIPQIIISLILKMPAFILALVRECTLSLVRCVRVLMGKDKNKLESMTVILAGTASAIVGVYAARVISNAVSGVPLLNSFNNQVTSVITGLVVVAVPLTAIYTFDQNKNKLSFVTSKFSKNENSNKVLIE